jgi:hypothetical protein
MNFDLDTVLEIGLAFSALLILGLCVFLVFRTMILPAPDSASATPRTEVKKKA